MGILSSCMKQGQGYRVNVAKCQNAAPSDNQDQQLNNEQMHYHPTNE